MTDDCNLQRCVNFGMIVFLELEDDYAVSSHLLTGS
jgi:hypothetical protein